MCALLIALYVIAANGLVVPTWCFVAAWVLTIIKSAATFINALTEYSTNKQ